MNNVCSLIYIFLFHHCFLIKKKQQQLTLLYNILQLKIWLHQLIQITPKTIAPLVMQKHRQLVIKVTTSLSMSSSASDPVALPHTVFPAPFRLAVSVYAVRQRHNGRDQYWAHCLYVTFMQCKISCYIQIVFLFLSFLEHNIQIMLYNVTNLQDMTHKAN